MRIIICDIYVKLVGHNLGHIQNILRYLEKNPSSKEYIFLLNPEAKTIPSVKTFAPNVKIIFFTEEEFAPFNSGLHIVKSTQSVWKHLMRYVADYQADKLIMMMLDMFQHTIGSKRLPCETSGIMFNPYPRVIPATDTIKEKQKTALKKARKIFTTWWMCRNSQLKKVFIFNDSETIKTMNETLGTKVFTYLPDPVYDYPMRVGLDIREKYNIPAEKTIFLAFGAIDDKKNIVNIIKALQKLSYEDASKICFVVVGRVRPEYENKYLKAINDIRKAKPELQIALENRFVDDDEMEAFVAQSDIISVAYINFYSSSGVIGIAARHNKPVIATKFGVVGDLTRDYKLGLTVDGHNSTEICEAVQYFLQNKNTYPERASVFVENHSGESFIKTLLCLE
jgi:glycosyltransferase involved in cell wall biosynthesis